MLHPTSSIVRAACATLLALSAVACAPGADPAKACAADTTLQGLKAVLFSAAAKGVDGVAGQGWASLQNVQLALDLPRLSAVDRTTKKITCEGRLTTTAPGAVPGQTPQRVTEDATYTVQPSAREGETVYEVAATPGTIGLIHAALLTRAKPVAAVSAQVLIDYGLLGPPKEASSGRYSTPERQLAEFRRFVKDGPRSDERDEFGAADWRTVLSSGLTTRGLFYKAWGARPDLVEAGDIKDLRSLEKGIFESACENFQAGDAGSDEANYVAELVSDSALNRCPKAPPTEARGDPDAT